MIQTLGFTRLRVPAIKSLAEAPRQSPERIRRRKARSDSPVWLASWFATPFISLLAGIENQVHSSSVRRALTILVLAVLVLQIGPACGSPTRGRWIACNVARAKCPHVLLRCPQTAAIFPQAPISEAGYRYRTSAHARLRNSSACVLLRFTKSLTSPWSGIVRALSVPANAAQSSVLASDLILLSNRSR
jgi:hypothetical protein